MTISKKRVLLALALGAVGAMVMASVASATHPRPVSALKISTTFVQAFEECTAGNRDHGPPLFGDSCNPPNVISERLQTGSDFKGIGVLKVLPGTTGPPEDSDVKIDVSLDDIRCDNDGTGDATGPCGAANTDGGGPDYAGALLALAMIRITDHYNGPSGGTTGGPDTATVVDLPFGAPVGSGTLGSACAHTPTDPTYGSDCDISTSANAVSAAQGGTEPAAKDGKRGVVEVSQLAVYDGGLDGNPTTTTDGANQILLKQGLFIP